MMADGPPNSALPIVFGNAEIRCFGWYHEPRSPSRDTGVVLCLPLGFEGSCAYETFTKLAELLSSSGFPVVRFDYHGTGDSAGGDADRDRVEAWLASASAAIDEVKRRTGVTQIALFGVRIGATLAAKVASRRGDVNSLVMWAPCVSGRRFTRELKAAAAMGGSNGDPAVSDNARDIESLGHLYTAQTLKDLGAIDLLKLQPLPAPHVLVIGRDDFPEEGPLPEAWRQGGIQVAYRLLPGLAEMMVEVHEKDVAHDTLWAIGEWLAERHPVKTPTRPALPAEAPVVETKLSLENVSEAPLFFGDEHRLFGILSEPAQEAPGESAGRIAILMLNVGTNHRIGPNRLYVKMARRWAARGYRALRFDLAGIGDSGSAATYSANRLYDKGSVTDVQQAMNCLAARGCARFILMGLCSGAYVAFQTALADPRVSGLVLMNPRRLEWNATDTLQSSMAKSYKSTHYYAEALRDPQTYARLLRGELDVRGVMGRMLALGTARLQRLSNRLLQRDPPDEDVLSCLKSLCARGTDALFIVGTGDDGLDYLQYHLGTRGRHMRAYPNFHMNFISGVDHTFSRVDSQEKVIEMVLSHLEVLKQKLPANVSDAQGLPQAKSARSSVA